VRYHIIENVHKHKIELEVKRTWHGVGEVEAQDGLDRGLEEVRLAICRHGKGLDGCLASAEDLDEDSADGCGLTRTTLGFALGFHGFQDGGGHIHNMDMDYHTLVMDCPMRLTAGAIGIHGALMPIHTPLINLGTFQRHTWHIGKGAN